MLRFEDKETPARPGFPFCHGSAHSTAIFVRFLLSSVAVEVGRYNIALKHSPSA
jgi:hypothetical protein